MKQVYIVDRFEEDYVVCEDKVKQMHDFKRSEFPKDLKVGDVVILTDNRFIIDQEETASRAEKIKSLMDSLWED
ncbi:MAG: DUF3006 domain-containing protein [bacterium]|nr:DUF3006 domain-containing protein [bacterium]